MTTGDVVYSLRLCICRHLIEQFAGDQLLMKINSLDVEYFKTLPPFYEQILHNIIKVTSADRPKQNNYIKLMNQPLWGNNFFLLEQGKWSDHYNNISAI